MSDPTAPEPSERPIPSQPPPEGVHPAPSAENPPAPGNDVAIVGVRMHDQVRISQFNSGQKDYGTGQMVVIDGEQLEIGEVVQPTTRARKMCSIGCMKQVLRVATAEDLEALRERTVLEKQASEYCRGRIRERGLPMKLVQAQQSESSNKMVFTFTADGRVDFRDLVRDLAHEFHSRIEMRQIGVRDEARVLGGYGDCGKALCCSSFLREFAPISIRMAREQNLSLNPSRISGMCGRLKCCLRYEYVPRGGDPALPPEDEPLPPSPANDTVGDSSPP